MSMGPSSREVMATFEVELNSFVRKLRGKSKPLVQEVKEKKSQLLALVELYAERIMSEEESSRKKLQELTGENEPRRVNEIGNRMSGLD